MISELVESDRFGCRKRVGLSGSVQNIGLQLIEALLFTHGFRLAGLLIHVSGEGEHEDREDGTHDHHFNQGEAFVRFQSFQKFFHIGFPPISLTDTIRLLKPRRFLTDFVE